MRYSEGQGMKTYSEAELTDLLKLSVPFLRSSCLRRTQRVVGDVLVRSITREIETADHDSPLLSLNI